MTKYESQAAIGEGMMKAGALPPMSPNSYTVGSKQYFNNNSAMKSHNLNTIDRRGYKEPLYKKMEARNLL